MRLQFCILTVMMVIQIYTYDKVTYNYAIHTHTYTDMNAWKTARLLPLGEIATYLYFKFL